MRTATFQSPCSSRRTWLTSVAVLAALLLFGNAGHSVTKVWTRTVDGPASDSDKAYAVAPAPNGAVYVVGQITVANEGANIWIRKFNSAGGKVWTKTVNGPAGEADVAKGAAADAAGNLYVVGHISTTSESWNIWIRKYSPSGSKLWTRTVNGPADGGDTANAAVVDGDGNLYVVGIVRGTTDLDNIWVRKYSSSGAKLWTRTVDGPANAWDAGRGAAVDGDGNLYVVGTIDTSGDLDIWIRKYSSTGSKIWTRTVDGPAATDSFDRADGAAVDADGNLYVTGYITVTGEGTNIWTRKYNSSGVKIWTRTVNDVSGWADRGTGIDASSGVHVIAHRTMASGSTVLWIRKYSPAGITRWTTTYTGPNGTGAGEGIALNETRRIFAVGSYLKAGEGNNIWARKYAP